VVDRLVEELGVELEVFSQHGRGSEFHLLLPAAILRPVGGGGATHLGTGETVRDPA
jgi:hypothetical protein